MNPFKAIMIIEGGEPEEYEGHTIDAWQSLIDNAVVWSLQGCYGRTAKSLIEQGVCSATSWMEG